MHSPADGCYGEVDDEGLLETLAPPSVVEIYFPASLVEKPFCFCVVNTFTRLFD